jgi:predicted metal-binding membrane protein
MWAGMMVAMMLPSAAPRLWRYRQAVAGAWLATLAGLGYFSAWILFGMAIYPLGIGLAILEMREPLLARTVPLATGVVILLAGAVQFTSFKARHLGCCRELPGHGRTLTADPATARRHGLRLAIHCIYCCGGFTAVLLAIGVMDLRAMAFVTAAITLERLAPGGKRVAQALGVVLTGLGLLLIARHLSPAGFFPLN